MFVNIFDALGVIPTAVVASFRAISDHLAGVTPKTPTTPEDGPRGVLIEWCVPEHERATALRVEEGLWTSKAQQFAPDDVVGTQRSTDEGVRPRAERPEACKVRARSRCP